jgi:hypothetical protein
LQFVHLFLKVDARGRTLHGAHKQQRGCPAGIWDHSVLLVGKELARGDALSSLLQHHLEGRILGRQALHVENLHDHVEAHHLLAQATAAGIRPPHGPVKKGFE